jgi:hypothetical protein
VRVRRGKIEAARKRETGKREDAMKKQIAVAVALMAASITAGQCYAQRATYKRDIPFAFQVANQTMPAGEYLIQRMTDTNEGVQYTMIRRTDSSRTAVALTFAVDAKNEKSEPELAFHKYGNRYFLSEIWMGQGQGQHLVVCERERELAREATGSEVAVSLQSVSERGL